MLSVLFFNDSFSGKNVVNVTNIKFENNEMKIDVFLQISIPLPTDLSIDGLDQDKLNLN